LRELTYELRFAATRRSVLWLARSASDCRRLEVVVREDLRPLLERQGLALRARDRVHDPAELLRVPSDGSQRRGFVDKRRECEARRRLEIVQRRQHGSALRP